MNAATETVNVPQPLVSPAMHVATAVAVVAFVAAAWVGAGRSSHEAVQLSSAALSRTYVTLPTVDVVAKRESAAAPLAQAATPRASSL